MTFSLAGLADPWLQNALVAGEIVALLAAPIGYFVVLRGAAFATHALSQIGFAGAAAAVLLGIPPLAGLVTFSLLGAGGLGALSLRARSTDVATALVLVFSLGSGALFLSLANGYGSNLTNFLFGSIVGVDRAQVAVTALTGAFALAALAAIARPLVFASVARDAARAAGAPVVALDFAFLGILGALAAITVPIVGALLVFSLTIGPAAAAARITPRPERAIALAAALGSVAVVLGIALAYATDWPVGTFIASLALVEYALARAYAKGRDPSAR